MVKAAVKYTKGFYLTRWEFCSRTLAFPKYPFLPIATILFRQPGDEQALQKYTALITLKVINDADFADREKTSGFQHWPNVKHVTKTPNPIIHFFPK